MESQAKLAEIAKQIRNQKAKEWRVKNKAKLKEINKRYWLKKAKEHLAKENITKEVQ